MIKRSIVGITIFIGCTPFLYGQSNSVKFKYVLSDSVEARLDSFTVVPETISLDDTVEFKYVFNSRQNAIRVYKQGKLDSVKVTYQTLPFDLSKPYAKRSSAFIDSTLPPTPKESIYFKKDYKEEIFTSKGINKNGNISRGLTLGNRQNIFVNSALNLQIEGKITEDVTLTAAISDQNVPFQPEGNTQQIQEFDRIYLQLDHQRARVTTGDIVLRNGESNFLRYYKNALGVQASVFQQKENDSTITVGSVGLAKGKFASQIIDVIEGVQGPYRLRGPSGERFVIILANSERVFLDGRMLKRGFDFDYVIDYNQGEIVFSNRVVITRFTRVRVDFEYSERNFSRSILQASHKQLIKNGEVYFNFYRERDNPRNPLAISLSNDDKLALQAAGDNILSAVGSGVDSVGFQEATILYEFVDTVINGQSFQYYRYSNNDTLAVWRLTFSEVGVQQGNYRQSGNTANGRIYEWIQPVNGVPQGSFEPVRLLPTPKEKWMATLGAAYRIGGNHKIYAEGAVSKNSQNLFSNIDRENDLGIALKSGYALTNQNLIGGYKLSLSVDGEYNQKNFSFIDRLRFIEFDRDWSADPTAAGFAAQDVIINSNAVIAKDMLNQLSYTISRRKRGVEVDGIQQKYTVRKSIGKLQFEVDGFLLKSQKPTVQSNWNRLSATTFVRGKKWQPGYTYSLDKNLIRNTSSDSIVSTAMNFDEHKIFIRGADSSKIQLEANYAIRNDNTPVLGELRRFTKAQTGNLQLQTNISKNQQIKALLTIRDFTFLSDTLRKNNELTLMGRIDWNIGFFNNAIRSELTYSSTSGRELKREFIYLQVPTGEGTHFWRDLNGNGTQELDEFFIALTLDQRQYVKLFVPTDEYILAYSSIINYRLNLQSPREWRQKRGFLRQMSKLSGVASVLLDQRSTSDGFLDRFIPIGNPNDPQNILSNQRQIRSTLFFNRTNPMYGADFGFLSSEAKSLLTGGFELREQNEQRLGGRLNLSDHYSLKVNAISGIRSSLSDFLTNRNFRILSREVSPELSFQPENTYRLSIVYSRINKKNSLNSLEGEESFTQKLQIEARVNQLNKRSINATASYINIKYSGALNSPVAFEMLEALNPGKNFTWQLIFNQRIANGLQLNVNYEGRKPQDDRIIHVGRIQLTALF